MDTVTIPQLKLLFSIHSENNKIFRYRHLKFLTIFS